VSAAKQNPGVFNVRPGADYARDEEALDGGVRALVMRDAVATAGGGPSTPNRSPISTTRDVETTFDDDASGGRHIVSSDMHSETRSADDVVWMDESTEQQQKVAGATSYDAQPSPPSHEAAEAEMQATAAPAAPVTTPSPAPAPAPAAVRNADDGGGGGLRASREDSTQQLAAMPARLAAAEVAVPAEQAGRPQAMQESVSTISGLKPLLDRLNLVDRLGSATAWCVENGAESVADLEGYEDDFASALSLPRIKKDKLIKALNDVNNKPAVPQAGRATESAPASPMMPGPSATQSCASVASGEPMPHTPVGSFSATSPTQSVETRSPSTDVAERRREVEMPHEHTVSARRQLQMPEYETPRPNPTGPVKSARLCSLMTAFGVKAPRGVGEKRRRDAMSRLQSFADEQPRRQLKTMFGPSTPPRIEREQQTSEQQGVEAILEQQQQMLARLEKRQQLAASRFAELRDMRKEVVHLRQAAEQRRHMHAQMSFFGALDMQRRQQEQLRVRQEQEATFRKIAQRQKEQLKAATESKLKSYRQEKREAERTKKRAEATLNAFLDLEKAKVKREKAQVEKNERQMAAAEEDVARIEARAKLLAREEDVCPPAWASPTGWVKLSVAKHYGFKLALGADGVLDGSEKLEPKSKGTNLTCERRELHWKFGSFRVVFLLKLSSEKLMAKSFILPRGKVKDWEDVESTARQYCLAKEFAKRFSKRLKEKQPSQPEMKLKYVTTDVLELTTGEYLSTEPCHGSEFDESEGEFIKWNNNGDFVLGLDVGGQVDPYPQALSHFSYVESKHAYLLTDVQGWKRQCQYILTDPAIHTNDRRKELSRFPGDSDHGYKGMQNFFATHRCNEICKLLDLHKDSTPKPPTAIR